MQQTDPSHVWRERCIMLGHRIAVRVGSRAGSVLRNYKPYDAEAASLLRQDSIPLVFLWSLSSVP